MVTSQIKSTSHLFQKGNPGKQHGVKNKLTIDIRDKFYQSYESIGINDNITGDEAFFAWSRQNKKTFYTLFAKLAPTNLNIHDGREHESFIDRMAQQIFEADAKVLDVVDAPHTIASNQDTMTITRTDKSQVIDSKQVNLDEVVSPSEVKS